MLEAVTPAGNLADTGTITFTDVDLTDTHSINPTVVTSSGALGTLTASVTTDSTGSGLGGVVTWNYSVAASAVEYLAKDQVKIEQFTITLNDGNGGTISRTIEVTVTGTNDDPVVATSDLTGAVLEAATPAGNLADTGTIAFTDVDLTDTHSINPTVVASSGALGTLTASVTADTTGSGLGGVVTWNYSVAASAVEYLAKDQVKVEQFTITLNDGNGGTVNRTIEVTITGTNDAPVVATSDLTGAVLEAVTPAGNLADTGTIAFTDVDLTDTHSINPTVVASSGALGTLTASVTTDTTGSGLGGVVTWNYSVAGLGGRIPRQGPDQGRAVHHHARTTAMAAPSAAPSRSPSPAPMTIRSWRRRPDRRGARSCHPGRQSRRHRHHRLHRCRPDRHVTASTRPSWPRPARWAR